MIKAAEVSGARALQDIAQVSSYLRGNTPRIWSAEFLAGLKDNQTLFNSIDARTAVEATSEMLLELDALFCLRRDLRYGRRSRRWLYTRAMRTRKLRDYEQWVAFAKENGGSDLRGKFLEQDPKTFAGKTYNELLDLPDGSTKLQAAQTALNALK
jgi:hypothetical protein